MAANPFHLGLGSLAARLSNSPVSAPANCEVEFLAVGDGSRAGDAIVARYGDANGWHILLVDGGTAETGEEIVKHLRKQYGPDVWINDMVLTHSDADHASGLREVLRQIRVQNVWLHVPWLHAEASLSLFSGNWTVEGLSKRIKDEYDIISEILELAEKQGSKIQPAFRGAQIGPFTILSPAREVYDYLLPQFDKTPEANQKRIEAAGFWIGKAEGGPLAKFLGKITASVHSWVNETWIGERLRDGGVTSASNESSVVLYGAIRPDYRVLLTGDAGVRALTWAADYAVALGLPLQNFNVVQIPHHGSRRNVGPTILNRILGPIRPIGTESFTAFVSAPKDDADHPRKIVLNAFMRRGGRVIATQGTCKVHWGGYPARPGYTAVTAIPFSSTVEDYT